MNMEMTLQDKTKKVSGIIHDALTVQKTNPVFVPVTNFSSKELGFGNARDVFRLLRENGVVKDMSKWWGYDEIKAGKTIFIKTDSDEAQTDDDFEVYEILVNEKKLNSQLPTSIYHPAKNEVDFDSQSGVIFFGRTSHGFQKGREGQRRLKLFQTLWDDRKVIKGGKTRPKGALFPAYALAVQLGYARDKRDFENNYEAKDKLEMLLKNTERTLQKKKIPIRIYEKGGVQIVINIP